MKHIRVISPAGAIDGALIDGAEARLRSWGYRVTEGRHARGSWGGYAGSDDERLSDLNEALADPSVDVILCTRGGYGVCRILDRAEVNPEHVPLIVGYSDITCLHNLMGRQHRPSLHSIMAKHIAGLPEESVPIVSLRRLLRGEQVTYSVGAHPFNREGTADGILRGGNMQVMYGLRGTPFDLIDDGNTILVIEDVSEPAHALDRIMQSLRMSGLLSRLRGLIVGRFAECREDERLRRTIYESIADAVSGYDFPVVFDFPLGHIEDNYPVMLNAPCRIEVSGNGARITTN